MRHVLREYQRSAVERVIASLDRRPILVAPTGSGKTTMATAIVEAVGQSTLWLAHRAELIVQAADRLQSHGLVTGIVMPGHRPMPLAPVQVASIQTLARRTCPPVGLVVIDECHHATAATYRAVLCAVGAASVIGLTATPFRLDGAGLGDLFGELVVAAHAADLCSSGELHAPRVYAPEVPDVSAIKVIAGEYNQGQLDELMRDGRLVGDIVATWRKLAHSLRTVVFAASVAHSRAIVEQFVKAGVAAEHIDGTTPRKERDAILERLASGKTRVVSNCMILTEGWDLPSLECAIIARPTASLNLHLQMVGRVMRAADGKDGAIVLDHAGNHHRHGAVTRRLTYSLSGGCRPERESTGLRQCSECYMYYDSTRYACPDCGWMPSPADYPAAVPQSVAGELCGFDDSSHEYRAEFWRSIEAERAELGYAPGWSIHRYVERFGARPIVVGGELVDVRSATQAQKQAVYEQLVAVAIRKGYRDGWASHRYRETFGVWPTRFVARVRQKMEAAR